MHPPYCFPGRIIPALILPLLTVQGQSNLPDTVCAGSSGDYWVTGESGSAFEWWVNGERLDEQGPNLTYYWESPGNYILSVRETNPDGCQGPLVSGNIHVLPEISSCSTISSCGPYSWNGKLYTGSGIYSAVFPSVTEKGCDSTAILQLTILPLSLPRFAVKDTLCLFEVPPLLPELSLEAVRGTWHPPAIETNLPGTSYYHFEPDPGQCAESSDLQVTISEPPVAGFSNEVACAGSSVVFSDRSRPLPFPISGWKWKITDLHDTIHLVGETVRHLFEEPGAYPVELRVTDTRGCKATTARIIEVTAPPAAAFTVEESKQGQLLLSNSSQGATEYAWDFGNGNHSREESPGVVYSSDGTFEIRLTCTNDAGCSDTASYRYDLMFKGLFVPNAFSPSSLLPGLQEWKPAGVNLLWYHAEIYDRWNERIWSSELLTEEGSPQEGWDGTYRGAPCPQGVYTWKILAVFRDGTIWLNQHNEQWALPGCSTTGSVTLIR